MKKEGKKMKKGLLLLLFASLILLNCSSKINIRDIKSHPRQYIGKEVKIEGKVTDIFSLALISYFKITDGTDTLFVYTNKPLPAKEEELEIKGKVRYFTFGTQRVIALEEE